MNTKSSGVALLLQFALFVSLFGQGGRFLEGQVTMQSGETLSGYVKISEVNNERSTLFSKRR